MKKLSFFMFSFLIITTIPALATPVDSVPPQEGISPVETAISADTATPAEIDAMKAQVLGNPELMAQIEQLAADPEIMKLLSDPTILAVAASNDPKAMQANPTIQKLLNHPKIKAMAKEAEASGSLK